MITDETLCKCGHDCLVHRTNAKTGRLECEIFGCDCVAFQKAITEADCKGSPVSFSREIIPGEAMQPGSIIIFCLENTVNLQSRNLTAYQTKRILKEMIKKIG